MTHRNSGCARAVLASVSALLSIAACDRAGPLEAPPDAAVPIECNLRCLYRLPYPAHGGLSGYTERVGTMEMLVFWDGLPARITANGVLELLPLPVPWNEQNNRYATVFAHPLGNRLGWFDPDAGTFEIFDVDGAHIASVPLPAPSSELNGYFPSFAADGARLILAEWYIDLEVAHLEGLAVADYTGAIISSLADAEALSLDSPQTTHRPDLVFQSYAEPHDAGVESGLLARRLDDCGEVYRIPGAREWALGDDGRHVFSLMGDGTLRWFEDGLPRGDAVPTTGAVWNLAVSPSGRFAAASEESLVLVDEDALVFQDELPDHYVLTLDVTDRGEVLAGVASEESFGRVLVLDSDGALIAEVGTGIDESAWRPWVERVFTQDHFFVRDEAAISMLEIVGRDPAATCDVSLSDLCGVD